MREEARPIWAVTPARMGSERLPGKGLVDLCGRPALVRIVERLRRVEALEGIVIATTEAAADDVIADLAAEAGGEVFRGSDEDVLGRVLGAARSVEATTVVLANGDNPLFDPGLIAETIDAYLTGDADYATSHHEVPMGLGVEVFATDALAEVEAVAHEPREREHVTLYFYEHPERFTTLRAVPSEERHRRPEVRLTLDTEDDLALIREIYETLGTADREFGVDEVLRLLDSDAALAGRNRHVAQRVP